MSDHPETWGTRVTVRFLKIGELDALVAADSKQQQWPKPTRSSVLVNLVKAELARRNLEAAPITKRSVVKNATLFDDRQLEAFESTVKQIAADTNAIEKRLKKKKPARAAVRHRRSAKPTRKKKGPDLWGWKPKKKKAKGGRR